MITPIERALANSTSRGYKPIIACDVEDSGKKVFKKQRISVVCDFVFELYDKKGESLTHSFSWLKLTGFKIIDECQVQLQFNKKTFQFASPQFKTFVAAIIDTSQRFLTKNELTEINFQTQDFFKSKATPISLIHRFEQTMKEWKIDLEPASIRYFRNLCITERKIIDLAEFPEPDSLIPLFFDCLPLMHFVSSLSVPSVICDQDAFDYLTEFIQEPSYLRHLTIDCKIDNSFVPFIQALKENNRSRITGLTFENSNFTIDSLTILTEVLTARSITSLGFHNAISQPARIYFCSTFFQGEFTSNLKYLDLRGTPNLDLRNLLPKVRTICVLNVESCGIEVSEIVSIISSIALPSLKIINISNNPFSMPLLSSPSIPKSVTTFIANKITFPDNNLVTLISFLFAKVQKPLNLSIADALASTDEWFRVFNFLQKTPYENLQSLTWDNNPTYPSLFEFLTRNKILDYLSLSGCFYESNHGPIVCLSDYLEQVSTLKTLLLRGFNASILGKYTVAALTSMRTMTSLEHLDVSFSAGGDDELMALRILVQELPNLRSIAFDGSRSFNPQLYSDLIKTCRNKEDRRVSVIFPNEDLETLNKKNVITDEEFNKLFDYSLHQPVVCDAQKKRCVYIRPENSPIDCESVIPTDDYTLTFPLFLTREEVIQLGGEEADDETVAPETVVIDYAVNDFEDNDDGRTIASLNFNQSKGPAAGAPSTSSIVISTPTASSIRSLPRENDNESVASKKRAMASVLRRARSERGESVAGDINDSPFSVKSGTSNRRTKSRNIDTPQSGGRSKTIISPFHQGLTAENVDRHSWEFPANYDIEFNQGVWKDAAAEFSIQSLFDEIRYEKSAIVHRAGDAQSVMSKRSKKSKNQDV